MDLMTELRDYLVAQAIVRVPRVAGSLPPLWLDPRDGVPAPGEGGNATEVGADAVLGAFQNNGIPPSPYASWQREDIVEFWIRTKTAPLARTIEQQLRFALVDRRALQMSDMLILESQVWREMQLLRSDAQGYTYTLAYRLQHYSPPGWTQ